MAASRSKRSNAGARMAEVMESDARDPFYASVYGGFYDEATDEDYKCTARAAPKKKKEDGSGPSGEKEEGAEDGASEEGSEIESEADSDADDGAEEDEEKEEAKEVAEVAEEKEPEQENETKSLNENKNDTKSINENGKTEPSKTIEEPSPKKVKLSEAES